MEELIFLHKTPSKCNWTEWTESAILERLKLVGYNIERKYFYIINKEEAYVEIYGYRKDFK